MDAVAVALMGVGGYLMYAAYKGEHPWTLAQQVISTTPKNTSTTTGK